MSSLKQATEEEFTPWKLANKLGLSFAPTGNLLTIYLHWFQYPWGSPDSQGPSEAGPQPLLSVQDQQDTRQMLQSDTAGAGGAPKTLFCTKSCLDFLTVDH